MHNKTSIVIVYWNPLDFDTERQTEKLKLAFEDLLWDTPGILSRADIRRALEQALDLFQDFRKEK